MVNNIIIRYVKIVLFMCLFIIEVFSFLPNNFVFANEIKIDSVLRQNIYSCKIPSINDNFEDDEVIVALKHGYG